MTTCSGAGSRSRTASSSGYYWVWSAYEHYQARHNYPQEWWGPLVHPAVVTSYGVEELGSPVARYRDAIRLMLPHYSFDGTMYGDIDQRFGDISQITLSRNGSVVGTAGWPQAQFSVPASDAEYELRLEVQHGAGNYMDLSSSTDTTWTFRSKRRGEGRTVLPLVQLDYDIDADGYNRVDASSTYPLRIETGYQPGFNGPDGFDVAVEVSYDDGETWLEARSPRCGGGVAGQRPGGSVGCGVRDRARDRRGRGRQRDRPAHHPRLEDLGRLRDRPPLTHLRWWAEATSLPAEGGPT